MEYSGNRGTRRGSFKPAMTMSFNDRNSREISGIYKRNYMNYLNNKREPTFAPPPIDPRRYNYQSRYNNNNENSSNTYANSRMARDPELFWSGALRPHSTTGYYNYALKEFSNQLPKQRRPSRLNVPWSRGISHSESGDADSFRQPFEALKEMDNNNWQDKLKKSGNKTTTVVELVSIQNDVCQSLCERDNYMDEVKKYNASNIDILMKNKYEREKSTPAEFKEQIRSCLANKKEFYGTWKLLMLLYGKNVLDEYVKAQNWSEIDLNSSKINKDIYDKVMKIEENFKEPST